MKQSSWLFVLFIFLFTLLMGGCRSADEEMVSPDEGESPAGDMDGADASPEGSTGTFPVDETSPQSQVGSAPIFVETEVIEPPVGSRVMAGTAVSHTVMEGEWLLLIARCYGASYEQIRQANPLTNPNQIAPGTTITVPNPGSDGPIVGPPCVRKYVVQAADTWQLLAQQFRTTTAVLQQINPGGLVVGQEILVPAVTQTVVQLPPLTHDLIFNFEGNVAVWRSEDGRLEVIETDAYVVDIVAGDSGDFVLLKQTPDGGATIEIGLLDRRTDRLTIIERGIVPELAGAGGENMLFSPDEALAVYLVRETTGTRATLFETASPAARRSVRIVGHGADEAIPSQLFLGSSADSFLWLDEAGVFQLDYTLDVGERRLYQIAAGAPDVPQRLEAVAWSPAGRYLLLRGIHTDGFAYYLLDAERGALVQLPGSMSTVTAAAASWLPDGTAAVFTPPATADSGPQITTYRPETIADELILTQLAQRSLSGPIMAAADSGGSGYVITTPAIQTRADQLVMTLQAANTAVDGMWVVTGDDAPPTRLQTIPADAYNIQWAPDGSGVLLEVPGKSNLPGDVVYLPGEDGVPFSLARWLGLRIADFHWTTP